MYVGMYMMMMKPTKMMSLCTGKVLQTTGVVTILGVTTKVPVRKL